MANTHVQQIKVDLTKRFQIKICYVHMEPGLFTTNAVLKHIKPTITSLTKYWISPRIPVSVLILAPLNQVQLPSPVRE